MKSNYVGVLVCVVAGCLGFLLGCSGDAEVTQDDPNMSPQQQLFLATARGDVNKIEEILAADPGLIMSRGPFGMTPLHSAAAAGQDKAVKLLLEKGADPTIEDENSNNAVSAAMSEGHKETAQIIKDWMQGATSPQ